MTAKSEFINNWKDWIEAFIINDIKKAIDKDVLEVGLIILTLLGIECLSAYYTGRRNSSHSTFGKFMKKYFPPSYAQYIDEIYRSLRNGLVHSYVPKRINIGSAEIMPFIMVRNQGEPHLQPCQSERDYPVYFNREQFARDFIVAWDNYVIDLETYPQLQENVKARAQMGFLIVDDVRNFIDL